MQANIYPWQNEQWQHVRHLLQINKLPHALLFQGPPGVGKKHFSAVLIQSLLCAQPTPDGLGCQCCHACLLFLANTHPNVLHVGLAPTLSTIGIDIIRDVTQFVMSSAQQGGYRFIIIDPIEALNIQAANALLKTLEEPTANVLFILVSQQQCFNLPQTLLSRCRLLVFPKPSLDMALPWLQATLSSAHKEEWFSKMQPLSEHACYGQLLHIVGGGPLHVALQLKNGQLALRAAFYDGLIALYKGTADPVRLAHDWQQHESVVLLQLLQTWLLDLLWLKLVTQRDKIINIDYIDGLLAIVQRMSAEHLLQYLEAIQALTAKVLRRCNLNKQLLLESVLIKWAHYVSC